MSTKAIAGCAAVAMLATWTTSAAEAPRVPALKPWSVRMADSEMVRHPDPLTLDTNGPPTWNYTQGLVLDAILALGARSKDPKYEAYVRRYYDGMIDAEGHVKGYRVEDFNIDEVNPGKALLRLWHESHEAKYRTALEQLRRQLREHPRTSEGGFWHKQIYPSQMWLDGLYMGSAFYAQYAAEFSESAAWDDIAHQFILMETHARDEQTGLLYHAWDESRTQRWADPATGRSRHFWGRAMGWYAMGLVDTLEQMPVTHPRRADLVAILGRLAEAVVKVQDPGTGVWWQILDLPQRAGNYRESSATTMFVYALAKGVRLGVLDARFLAAARTGYEGILKQFIEVDADGVVSITKACAVAGLGGRPYRDGSYEYYVGEKIRSNDPKAVGPFVFASLELEGASQAPAATQPKRTGARVQVLVKESERRVDVLLDGAPFTAYIWPESLTKPVLWPIRSAQGTAITRGFPLEPLPGERTDHPHHVGLWFNYGDVDGVDFWNNSSALGAAEQAKMGRSVHRRIVEAKSGDEGRLTVAVEWVMPSGTVVVDEQTTFSFRPLPDGRLIERTTRLTARAAAVKFPDNKEGTLGLRVARALEQPSTEAVTLTDASGRPTAVPVLDNAGVTGRYHSSEGKEGDAVWGTRGRWVALTGRIGQQDIAVVMLDHPKNPGAPTYWHARGYGLFAANPLGQKALSNGKEELNFALAAHGSVTFRHVVAILDGPWRAERTEELYRDFAK
jgi:unsaturated rhamnogalacturonyl hydrolase